MSQYPWPVFVLPDFAFRFAIGASLPDNWAKPGWGLPALYWAHFPQMWEYGHVSPYQFPLARVSYRSAITTASSTVLHPCYTHFNFNDTAMTFWNASSASCSWGLRSNLGYALSTMLYISAAYFVIFAGHINQDNFRYTVSCLIRCMSIANRSYSIWIKFTILLFLVHQSPRSPRS